MVQLTGLVGAGSGQYVLRQLQLPDRIVPRPEPAVLAGQAVRAGRDPEHGLRHAVHQRFQRGRRITIDLLAAGARVAGEPPCPGADAAVGIPGVLAVANNNPSISAATSNKRFGAAVRYALDYPSFVRLAGPGAIQARGIIPSMFLGALPASAAVAGTSRVRAASSQRRVSAGGPLEYPSDLSINGVAFATLAQRVQANLQDIGIKVGSPARLSARGWTSTAADDGGRPVAVGTETTTRRLPRLHAGRARRRARRLAEGRRSGTRAAGRNGARHDNDRARAPIYGAIQRRLNQSGPCFPWSSRPRSSPPRACSRRRLQPRSTRSTSACRSRRGKPRVRTGASQRRPPPLKR